MKFPAFQFRIRTVAWLTLGCALLLSILSSVSKDMIVIGVVGFFVAGITGACLVQTGLKTVRTARQGIGAVLILPFRWQSSLFLGSLATGLMVTISVGNALRATQDWMPMAILVASLFYGAFSFAAFIWQSSAAAIELESPRAESLSAKRESSFSQVN